MLDDRLPDFAVEVGTPSDEAGSSLDTISISMASQKIPLDQSPALLFVRQTLDDFEDGELSDDEFVARITRLYNKTEHHLSQFSEQIEDALAAAEGRGTSAAEALEDALECILEGCEHLLRYDETQDAEDLDTGMDLIEQGFEEMDTAEAQALEELEKQKAAE